MQTKLDILFIGKSNSVNTELYNAVSEDFSAQISADSLSALKTTLSFVSPSMILFSLAGYADAEFLIIMRYLASEPEHPPILVICDEKQSAAAISFLSRRQFSHLLRPTTNENIISTCRQLITSSGKLPHPAAPKESVLQSNEDKRPHVLIIDDNAITLRVTKRLLENDYSVAIAVSSSQAFMSIAKKKPNVILLDYEMPLINGEAAMLMLKENKDTADIPVIFFTGAADSETVRKLLSLSPAGYILKPPDRQKLIELIEKTIRR